MGSQLAHWIQRIGDVARLHISMRNEDNSYLECFAPRLHNKGWCRLAKFLWWIDMVPFRVCEFYRDFYRLMRYGPRKPCSHCRGNGCKWCQGEVGRFDGVRFIEEGFNE